MTNTVSIHPDASIAGIDLLSQWRHAGYTTLLNIDCMVPVFNCGTDIQVDVTDLKTLMMVTLYKKIFFPPLHSLYGEAFGWTYDTCWFQFQMNGNLPMVSIGCQLVALQDSLSCSSGLPYLQL